MLVNRLHLWAFHAIKCYCGSGKKYKQCHLPVDNGNPPDDWHVQYEKAYGEAPVGK